VIRRAFETLLSSAVLMRESARTSRQWQTYAARTFFSGFMLSVLLAGVYMASNAPRYIDPATMGQYGRYFFIGFSVVQIFMAVLLGPLMVAASIVEETEDRTLELVVLTQLKPPQILSAKVLSRVLVLATIVLGAMPVVALVATLGGVSVVEVVTVTVHTLVTVALLGALGGFFGLFTRSPLLALMASAGYGTMAFLFWPIPYTILTGDQDAGAHFSTLMGPFATDWSALLPVLTYIPIIGLVMSLGTRLFDLKVSRADIRRAFSSEVWEWKKWGMQLGALVLLLVVLLPAVVGNWTFVAAKVPVTGSAWTDMAVHFACRAFTWAWCVGALHVATRAYLRIAVDVVDALDTVAGGGGNRPTRRRGPVHIWSNPVLWREARPRAWGVAGLPLLITWLLILLGLFQTGIWLAPGGLVAIGALNTSAALVLTAFLATRSIERERQIGSLQLLLTTPLAAWKIVFGKTVGAGLATFIPMLISAPMLAIGVPYWSLFTSFVDNDAGGGEAARLMFAGVLAWMWAAGLWAVTIGFSMWVALKVKRARTAFAAASGGIVMVLAVPIALGRLFAEFPLIAIPAEILAPGLAGETEIWQYCLGIVFMGFLALFFIVLTTVRLRGLAQGFAAIVLAAMIGFAPAAQAQQVVKDDGFLMAAAPLAEGVVRKGEWAQVSVVVKNQGRATSGTLVVSEARPDAPSYRRPIELPKGSQKLVRLLYKVESGVKERRVRLVTRDGREVSTEFETRLASPNDVTIGMVGQDAMGLLLIRDAHEGPVPGPRPRPITGYGSNEPRPVRSGVLGVNELPQHRAGYAALDWLVWPNADPTDVTEGQQEALLDWVADGGHLLITVADKWREVSTSTLAAALPVELTGSDTVDNLDALLAAFSASSSEKSVPMARATIVDHPGRSWFELVRMDDGRPGWVVGTYGLGTISVVTADPTVAPLKGGVDRLTMWRRLLFLKPVAGPQRWVEPDIVSAHIDSPAGAEDIWATPRSRLFLNEAFHRVEAPAGHSYYANHFGFTHNDWDNTEPAQSWEAEVRRRLSRIPGVAPVPPILLLGFSVLYLLIIGPLDYSVLRFFNRQPLTWITFPFTIGLFSAIALVGTSMTKGSQAVRTRVETVDFLPGTSRARGTTYIGVFSTRKTTVGVGSGFEGAVVEPLLDPGFMEGPKIWTDEGAGSMEYGAQTWTLAYSKSEWVIDHQGTVALELLPDDAGWAVTNKLGFDLDHAELIIGWGDSVESGGRYTLDALADGERKELKLSNVVRAWRPPANQDAFMNSWEPEAELDPNASIGWDNDISLLYDQPDLDHGYLDLGNGRISLVGTTTASFENLELTGLSPVDKNRITVVRVPLTPPLTPGNQSRFGQQFNASNGLPEL
jgi:ABC-type transport system involved in multi-copper enzyme maturation permease subunit